jgi:spore germination protein GerM
VLCIYTLSLSATSGAGGSASTAEADLNSDSANPPTTSRATVRNVVSGGVSQNVVTRAPVMYIVPANDNVKLVTATTGTASVTLLQQTEEAL